MNRWSPVSFSHIALNVSDIVASAAFYRDVLGFEQFSQSEIKGGLGHSAGFRTPSGVALELLQLNDADGQPTAVSGAGDSVRLAFGVEDIDTSKLHLADHGVAILHEMQSDGIEMVFFTDPDGRTIELDSFPGDDTSFTDRHTS